MNIQLSASKLGIFESCPLRYRFNYIDGLLGEVSSALAIGTLTHRAISHCLKGEYPWKEIETETDPANRDAVDLLGKAREYFKIFEEFGMAEELYSGKTDVEFNFQDKVERGHITIVGFIDLLLPDRIVEFKTSSSKNDWDQLRADVSPQSYIYARAGRKLTKKWLPVEHIIINKASRKIERFITKITQRSYGLFLRKRVSRLLADNKFEPTAGEHCRWCPYRNSCESKYRG